MADWQRAALAEDVWSETVHGVVPGGVKVVLVRTSDDDGAQGAVCAYRDACPHEKFPLSEWGRIESGVLVCQRHFWEFEIDSGKHITRIERPDCNLVAYPVKIDDGAVWVDVEGALPNTTPTPG